MTKETNGEPNSDTPLVERPTDQAESHRQLTDYRLLQRDYLLRIARAMSERLALREVLSLVIRSAVAMTGGQAGAIVMRSDDDSQSVAVSYRLEERVVDHLDTLFSDAPQLPPPDDASAADRSAPQYLELDSDQPYQMLSLPLAARGDSIGRIVVLRNEGAAVFTPLDTELLQAFADQAAVAIHNAQLHEQLTARERLLDTIVRNNPAALLLTDARGRILTANPALESITDCSCDAVEGMHLDELLPLNGNSGEELEWRLPTGAEAQTIRGYLARTTPPAGAGPFLQVTVTPLTGVDGEVERYVVSVVDLTAYRKAEEAKRVFLAGMSHELKTPLSLIRGYAETLRHPQVRADSGLYHESLDIILTETERLTEMVNRLLQAARLELGAPTPNRDALDVGHLLEQLVERFRRTDSEHDWELDRGTDLPIVAADRLQLSQVFENLLTNAAKYSPSDTTVRIEARPHEAGIRVAVKDEGIGLTSQEREHLFERFYRASGHVEGTGLGLYMSRAIVEAHGGSIEVESSPGHGTTFTVVLPGNGRPVGSAAAEETQEK